MRHSEGGALDHQRASVQRLRGAVLPLAVVEHREVVQHPERLNDAGLDLIAQMLKYTPNERIVAKDALEHPYFANLDKATVGTIPLPI